MRTVVVGASSGLGRCIGVGLAQRGARVALLARRRGRLDDAAKEAGPGTVVAECDVTDETSCRAAIDEAAGELGGIDALVYAPGIGPLARLVDTDAETWRRVFATNVTGAALVTAAAVPHLIDSAGTAVYLSSVSASLTPPWPGLGAYAVSKAALDKLVEAWRAEHPGIGFTRLVVGDCAGGEGDARTGFADGWDLELAAELHPVWAARNYLSESLLDVDHLVAVVDAVLRGGASLSMPSVTVAPRPSVVPTQRIRRHRRPGRRGPPTRRGARVTTTAAVEFDPFSDEYFNDPTEVYRRLRDEAPVYYSERYGFYALSRFADLVAAHRDWKGLSSAHGVDLSTMSKDPELIRSFRIIIMMDPPEHDRFRALVSRVFTPRAVTALEPMIREVISSFLEPLAGADSFDAVADFSALFPVEIISRMLGVPEGDRQQIRHWVDTSLHREPGQHEPTPEGMEAILAQGAYYYELVQEKRRNPADDMLSRLTQVTVDRGDGEQTGLDDTEITGFASLLGGAGAETVTKLVGNAVVLFSRHPDQWQKVLDDPDKISGAVEEILRYLPPSQYQGRFSVEEREYEGGTIPAGFPVLLLTGAATRDPRAFERPDDFDIERPPNVAVGFGHGVHSCLGAALARMESRIALEELARRWQRLEVDDGGLRRVHMSNVAGYSNVPVRAVG